MISQVEQKLKIVNDSKFIFSTQGTGAYSIFRFSLLAEVGWFTLGPKNGQNKSTKKYLVSRLIKVKFRWNKLTKKKKRFSF